MKKVLRRTFFIAVAALIAVAMVIPEKTQDAYADSWREVKYSTAIKCSGSEWWMPVEVKMGDKAANSKAITIKSSNSKVVWVSTYAAKEEKMVLFEPLKKGQAIVTVKVTYQNGSTKTYKIGVGVKMSPPKVSNSTNKTAAKKAKTTYTVKYNLNGGKGNIKNQTKTKGKSLKLRTKKPEKKGYTFKGWSVKKNGAVKYKAGGTYKTNSSVTLYASWKRIPKIHILAIGGFNSTDEKKGASAAGDDAKALYKRFNKNKLSGYEKGKTVLYTPKGAPTAKNINDKIKKAFGNAKEEDLCFFLYAGHGTCDINNNGLGLTISGDIDYYSYTDLVKKIDKTSKAHVVMIISACHSGGFAKAAKESKNKNVTVFTACDANETTGNSAFTISNTDKYSKGLHIVSVASSLITGKDTRRSDLVDLVIWGMNLKKIGKKGKITAEQFSNFIRNNIQGGRNAQTWIPYPKMIIYKY